MWGHFLVWTKHQNGTSGGLASLSGPSPGLPGRLKASRNSCYSLVLTPGGPARPKVCRGGAQGGPRDDMPPTGHCATFLRNQMAAWCAKMARQIGAKLRIQIKTELSVLLSAEVIRIGVEDHIDSILDNFRGVHRCDPDCRF